MMIHMYTIVKKRNRSTSQLMYRFGFLLALFFFMIATHYVGGTNAYFSDEAQISTSFATGQWIPLITMDISPDEPEDGVYVEAPCIKILSDIDDVTIFYEFEGDVDADGHVDEGECFYPPEGESMLSVYAVNNANDHWKSDVVTHEFFVAQQNDFDDVVINELMWMGSFEDDDDEWIELRNMTDHDIDLSHWNIDGAGKGTNGHIEIPQGYTIKAQGYFLITKKKWKETEINLSQDLAKDEGYTHVAGMDLRDKGEKLTLKDRAKNTIDSAWKDAMWSDGWHGIFLHMSMERDDVIGDGAEKANWHTCLRRECNDRIYWRHEGLNFGTPGQENSTKKDWIEMDHEQREYKEIKELRSDSEIIENIWDEHFDAGEKNDDMHGDVVKKHIRGDHIKAVDHLVPQDAEIEQKLQNSANVETRESVSETNADIEQNNIVE